jgi:hypothetical protein
MARITAFSRGNRASLKHQPTEVVCLFSSANVGGKRIVQLDTLGSKDRENPGKQSQTLQIDEARAVELIAILKSEFRLS